LVISLLEAPGLSLAVLNAVIFIQNGKFKGINRFLIYPAITEPIRLLLNIIRAGQNLNEINFVTRCFRIPNIYLINLFVVHRILAVMKHPWVHEHRKTIRLYYKLVMFSLLTFYFICNILNYVKPSLISMFYDDFKTITTPAIGMINLAADIYFIRALASSVTFQQSGQPLAYLAYIAPIALNLFYLACKISLQFKYQAPGDPNPLSHYDDYAFGSLAIEMFLALNVTKNLVDRTTSRSERSGTDSESGARSGSQVLRQTNSSIPSLPTKARIAVIPSTSTVKKVNEGSP
jgi:hypothetical protein